MIPFHCFNCDSRWSLDEESADEVRECPECEQETVVEIAVEAKRRRSPRPAHLSHPMGRFMTNDMSSGVYLGMWGAVGCLSLAMLVIPWSLLTIGWLIVQCLVPR